MDNNSYMLITSVSNLVIGKLLAIFCLWIVSIPYEDDDRSLSHKQTSACNNTVRAARFGILKVLYSIMFAPVIDTIFLVIILHPLMSYFSLKVKKFMSILFPLGFATDFALLGFVQNLIRFLLGKSRYLRSGANRSLDLVSTPC